MEDWLSFIIFAALFYVMMRYGCGAHMIHGHQRKHGNHQDDETKHVDPVCGMNVDITQGYGKMHQGILYRFCSRNCLDKFENNPDKYLTQSDGSGGEA